MVIYSFEIKISWFAFSEINNLKWTVLVEDGEPERDETNSDFYELFRN